MDDFHKTLAVDAATIDELLSDEFEPLRGGKSDAERAGTRLGAWCKASASGDWSLFERRLARDGLGFREALTRFAAVRRRASVPVPAWVADATWIDAALQSTGPPAACAPAGGPVAFQDALQPIVDRACAKFLKAGGEAVTILDEAALSCLRASLLKDLSDLLAPALYELFAKARAAAQGSADRAARPGRAVYDRFIAEMRNGGFRRLFHEKPVLLRLLAVLARQWIETSCEFVVRLCADAPAIRRILLDADPACRIVAIEDRLSDPHNGGRTVKIIAFNDGAKVVYKPKALQLDVALHALIVRLNGAGAPIDLRAAAVIAREGYGWAAYVAHADCGSRADVPRFFRRSGAWLALLHGLVGTDMHHENIVAVGDHPVPIDLEMMLQPSPVEHRAREAEDQALADAMEQVANSVVAVGLLPAYARSPDKSIVSVGGVEAQRGPKPTLGWEHTNSDGMRPVRVYDSDRAAPNMPRVDGEYAAFGDHVDDFVAGFEAYARFLARQAQADGACRLLDGFAGARVRKVVRPTRFYDMLLRRLKDHRTMTDGVTWSAQADFGARLSDWDDDSDPLWPLQRAERAALTELNVPYFMAPSDGAALHDSNGLRLETAATPGIDRARARLAALDEPTIATESEIIRQTTTMVVRAVRPAPRHADLARMAADPAPRREALIEQADRAADALRRHAIEREGSAAWIGLDWLGDSEVGQLVALGVDLYNGNGGIALFLAAHAAVAACKPSEALAQAALAHVRKTLHRRSAARLGRVIGLGAGTGLGSVIYALSCVADLLRDERYLDDARAAARLVTCARPSTRRALQRTAADHELSRRRHHRPRPQRRGVAVRLRAPAARDDGAGRAGDRRRRRLDRWGNGHAAGASAGPADSPRDPREWPPR